MTFQYLGDVCFFLNVYVVLVYVKILILYILSTNIQQILMSVHKPRASTARARIPAAPTSVSVTRVGQAHSVTKVMDTRQFGNCESLKMNSYKLLLNHFSYRV